jgi:predicted tellurium resistance membrane protein TerC
MEAFFTAFTTAQGWIDLLTLLIMEIVLGIDNIIFIAIITGFLSSKSDQIKARRLGLFFALIFRIALLFTLSYLAHLQEPFFKLAGFPVSGRGLVLLAGGLFLIIKTSNEIRHRFLISDHEETEKSRKINLFQAIIQITIIDIVFSFDSIITAVGLVEHVPIMVVAVVIAMFVMLAFAPYVSAFIEKYPTLKMLALAFLIVIGLNLVAEACESAHLIHIPEHVDLKIYSYVAFAFALIVELLNIRLHHVKERKTRS